MDWLSELFEDFWCGGVSVSGCVFWKVGVGVLIFVRVRTRKIKVNLDLDKKVKIGRLRK